MVVTRKNLISTFGLSQEKAGEVLNLIGEFDDKNKLTNRRPDITMGKISKVLGFYGAEYIPAGKGAKSPAITYANSGDTYDATILFYRGKWRIGAWGDIVEGGNYA